MSGWQDAPVVADPASAAKPAWASAPVQSAPDEISGDVGDGGEPVENERIPAAPMARPLATSADDAEQARVAAAKANPNGPAGADHAAWVMHNAVATPEQGTIAADLAPAAARAPGYVLQHLPGVQLEQNQQQSADDLARAPTLAGVASQSVAHATMMKDDTSVLADLTNAIVGDWTIPEDQQLAFAHGAGGDLTHVSPVWLRKLGEGMREWRANNLTNFNTIFGSPRTGLGPKSVKEEAALTAPATDDQPEDKGSISQAVGSAAGMVPYMAGAIGAGNVGEALGGKPGKVVALAGYNLWETLGPAVRSLRAAQNPDGSPTYSDAEVRNLALLSAAGQTAAMTAVEVATNSVFGAPLVRGEVNAAATQWLNSGGAALIKGFAARYSFHAAMGAFVMAAQHSIHAATEEFGKDWNFQAHDYSRPFTEFFPAFKQGLETMILPAAISPTMDVMGRHPLPAKPTPEQMEAVGQRANTQQEQAKLETLISGAEASKLGKRSPAQLQAALAPATEQQGASDTAFIDKEAFDKKHGPLAQQVATEQGGNYPEAHALNAPVTIPLEAHLANVADGTARELMPDTKLTPLGKTPNEIAAAPDEPITLGEADRLPDKSPIQEAREAIRAQVDAEAEADPAGRALKILQAEGGLGQKLDRQYVNDNMDKKTAAALDALGVLKHNQMQPSDLANQLGFANAHELAHAILNPDLSEQGRQVETERRLLAQFPDANKTPAELKLAQVTVELRKLQEELANTQSRLKVAGAADLAAAQAAHARAIEALKGEQERIVGELTGDRKQTKDLTQGALRPGEDDLKAVKADAEAGVSAKALGDIDPNYYLAAERAAANRAQEAAAKGDIQGAVDAKRQQIASVFAGRFARDIKADLGRTRAGLNANYTPEARGLLAQSNRAYLDGVDITMEAIGVKKPLAPTNWWAQGQDSARATALASTFDRMDADGFPRAPGVEEALTELVNPANGKFKDWNKLTPDEAKRVAGGIKEMQIAARSVREVDGYREKLALNDAIQQVQEETNSSPDIESEKYTSGNPKPALVKAREFLNSWNAQELRFKENVRDLGPLASKIFFDGMIAARTYKEDLAAKVAPFFDTNWRQVPKEIAARAYEPTDLRQWFPLPEGQKPLAGVPRTWLYSLHLHNMSEGNMDRVLGGPLTLIDPAATRAARAQDSAAGPVMWQQAWKQADVNHVLYENPATRLTRAEADFLQGVTDHVTKGDPANGVPSLWDLIKQKQEDRFGIAPPKVAGVPRTIQFADGTSKAYEGGYHHLSEDRGATPRSEKVMEDISDFFGKGYQFAQTSSGFAKEREVTAKYMTDMTWDSIPAHITQVIHDLAFGDWVRGAGRLALNPEFKQTADRVLGSARADQLRNQIRVVATGQSDSIIKGSEAVWNAIRWSKDAGVTGIVGYSIPMALGQLSHIPGMLVGGKVSLRYGIPALLSTLKPIGFDADGLHAFPNIEAAQQLSSELRHRSANATQIMGDVRTVLGSQRQGLAKALVPADVARQHAGIFLHMVDTYLSAWAFNASRAEGQARGMSDEDAEHYANGVVQDIMPDHSIETAAPLLVDRKLGAATLIMHGFGNTLYNMAYRDVVRPFSEATDAGNRMGQLKAGLRGMQHGAMLAVLGTVGKLLWGHGPQQGESWGAWFTRTALAAPGMLVPYLGGAAEWAAGKTTQALPDWLTHDGLGKGPAKSLRYSEMQAPGFAIYQKFHELVQHLESKQPEAGGQKALEAMKEIMLGLHVAVPGAAQAGYLSDVRTGRMSPRGPGDVVSGLLGYSGRDRNIPTAVQDQFSQPGTSQRRGK